MTTTPPPTEPPVDAPDAAAHEGPRVTRDEVRDLGRLRRSVTDRKVAGVAGGLARHLDIDPILLRVGFVVLAFFGGAGLILYAAGWALVPEEGDDRAAVHLDERNRTIALVALGVFAALALVGDSWGGGWFPWPLALIGLAVFVWLSRSRDRREARYPHPPDPADPSATGSAPAYTPVPLPRDPRKRGPRLFWFTLLLIAVAEGILGIVDGAGVPVLDSAYAALAVGIVAVMLVVGAFVGRAGGLIALGVVAALALSAASATEHWDEQRLDYRPTSAAEVADTYAMEEGTLVLDLTGLRDPDALDGRTIEVTGEVGEIFVEVPEDAEVRAEVAIEGPGVYDLFDGQHTGGGIDSSGAATWRPDGADPSTDPSFTVVADLEVGRITVEAK